MFVKNDHGRLIVTVGVQSGRYPFQGGQQLVR